MAIDYLTGVSKGYVNRTLNSNRGFRGIVKKVCMLGIVAIAVIIDRIIGNTGIVRNFTIYYLIANDGLSIIENLGEMGIVVPDFLKKRLEQLKDIKEGSESNAKRKENK